MAAKKRLEEQVIQKLLYRCPYCDQPVTYDDLHLKLGENKVKCPSCKRTYIKLVTPSFTEGDRRPRRHLP